MEQTQLRPAHLIKTHNRPWSAVSMPAALPQSYRFTVELSVILLSSDGLKQLNYSIHTVVCLKD